MAIHSNDNGSIKNNEPKTNANLNQGASAQGNANRAGNFSADSGNANRAAGDASTGTNANERRGDKPATGSSREHMSEIGQAEGTDSERGTESGTDRKLDTERKV